MSDPELPQPYEQESNSLPAFSRKEVQLPNGERKCHIGQVFSLFTKEAIAEYQEGRRPVVLSRIALELDQLSPLPFMLLGNPHYIKDEESINPFGVKEAKTVNGRAYSEFYPLHLWAQCSEYDLEELGLSSEEKYKYDDWYVVREDVMRVIDRLRLQALFPNGEIYESLPTLSSTRRGSFDFDRFYPSNQPPATNEWVNRASIRETIYGGRVGKPLALVDDESKLAAVNGRFILADENSVSADFRVKTHLAHIQSHAKSAFYCETRDMFNPDQLQKLKEGYVGWVANNIPFEQLIEHINKGYTSPRITAVVNHERPLRKEAILNGWGIVTDGKCSMKDWGTLGTLVGIEDASYYACLLGPAEEYELVDNPGRPDLIITTPFNKKEMLTRLKSAGVLFPSNLTWHFRSGIARQK